MFFSSFIFLFSTALFVYPEYEIHASRQDREGGYIDFESGEDVEYLPFWLISTRLSCKVFNNSTIFLEINNLFDNEYVDFGNIPQPGRWMRAGVKITI